MMRTPRRRRLAAFSWAASIGLALLAGPARGDSWAPPRPAVFASEAGSYWVKTSLRGRKAATVTLYTYGRGGSSEAFPEQRLWSEDLSYIPARLLVSDDGWVVGVDEYARMGYEHSLVVWSPSGERLADDRLEDLLTPDEIRARTLQSISSRSWHAAFQFHRVVYQGTFDLLGVRIVDGSFRDSSWEKRIAVDLRTGSLWPDCDPEALQVGPYAASQHAISLNSARYSRPEGFGAKRPPAGGFTYLYARQNKHAASWELHLEPDGTALLKIRRGGELRTKLSARQMEPIQAALREARLLGLPETLSGSGVDPHLRSLIVETPDGLCGMTLLRPNELSDEREREQAGRFLRCWLQLRDALDGDGMVDERAEVRDYRP